MKVPLVDAGQNGQSVPTALRINLKDLPAVKHDGKFTRTGSLRFEDESKPAFVETGG